jgi:hypothetical protein
MRPSGLPVVNEKSADHRDVATNIPKANVAPDKLSIDFINLLVALVLFVLFKLRSPVGSRAFAGRAA